MSEEQKIIHSTGFPAHADAEVPNWSTFDYWYLVPDVEAADEVATLYGMRPDEEAEHESDSHTDYEAALDQGDFLTQDLSLAVTQQRGLRCMAFADCYLAAQETRVRRFHEVINDYMESRR